MLVVVLELLVAFAVLFGVAAVAAGRGDPMAGVRPDRPEFMLPHDRELSLGDLDTLRFSVSLRGYRMSEVDEVLDRIGAGLIARDARIAELEAQLAGDPEPAGGPSPPPPGEEV